MTSFMKVRDNTAYLTSLLLTYSTLPKDSYVFYIPHDAETVSYADVADEETQLITLNRVLNPKGYDVPSYLKKVRSKFKLNLNEILHVYGTLDTITGNTTRTYSSVHILREYGTGKYTPAPIVNYSGCLDTSNKEATALAAYCLKLFADKGPAFTVDKAMLLNALSNCQGMPECQRLLTRIDMYPEVFK